MDENEQAQVASEPQVASDIAIHVRFAPDGTVSEIGSRPGSITPQAWFNALSASFGTSFRALTGGRGIFVIAAEKISALQSRISQPN